MIFGASINKTTALVLALLIIVISGCTELDPCDIDENQIIDQYEKLACQKQTPSICGDMICDISEQQLESCPIDCTEYTQTPLEVIDYSFQITEGNSNRKIINPTNGVIDTVENKLYIASQTLPYVAVINTRSDRIEKTIKTKVLFNELVLYQSTLYGISKDNQCYQIHTHTETGFAEIVSMDYCNTRPYKEYPQVETWRNFQLTYEGYVQPPGDVGFPQSWQNNLNGPYGIITIINTDNNQEQGKLQTGLGAKGFILDKSLGKLYTVNDLDNTINAYDLNQLKQKVNCDDFTCKSETIKLGHKLDTIQINEYNQLFGLSQTESILYALNQNFDTLKSKNVINNGIILNPIGPIIPNKLDLLKKIQAEDEAFNEYRSNYQKSNPNHELLILGQYEPVIQKISTHSLRIVDEIKLPLRTNPRTSVPATLLQVNNQLFVAYPETGTVFIITNPFSEEQTLQTLDISKYNEANVKEKIEIEVSDKIYVLAQNILHVYGITSLKEEKISIIGKQKAMISDDVNLYIGTTPYSKETLYPKPDISLGEKIIHINGNKIYTYTKTLARDKEKYQEKVYEFIDNKLSKEWVLDEIEGPSSEFLFNDNNQFYVIYTTDLIIKKYSLLTGTIPKNPSGVSCDFDTNGYISDEEINLCMK